MTGHLGRRVIGLTGVLIAAATISTPTRGPIPQTKDQWPVLPPYVDRNIEADLTAIREFDRRVADYVALHRLLEGPLPPLQTSRDMRQVRAAMDALALRLEAARKDAQPGDIITVDVSRLFRKRIAACLSPEEWEAFFAELEEPGGALPPLRVNARWPALMPFNLVPPQLLAALPPLPPELQYRVVGRSLVLWDHHADLIVDFMPGAFTS